VTIDNSGNSSNNPLDAWSQSIDKPPHQVGGRARTIIEKSRTNPNHPTRRQPGSSPFSEPGQAVSQPNPAADDPTDD
jgi:hypothetical protein